MKTLFILIASLYFCSAVWAKRVDYAHEIVPGKRAGLVFIDMTRQMTYEKIGVPRNIYFDAVKLAPGDKKTTKIVVAVWRRAKEESFLKVAFLNDKAIQIMVTFADYATKTNFHVDTPFGFVEKKAKYPVISAYVIHSDEDNSNFSTVETFYDYISNGLTLRFYPVGALSSLTAVDAVIVHKKGTPFLYF